MQPDRITSKTDLRVGMSPGGVQSVDLARTCSWHSYSLFSPLSLSPYCIYMYKLTPQTQFLSILEVVEIVQKNKTATHRRISILTLLVAVETSDTADTRRIYIYIYYIYI